MSIEVKQLIIKSNISNGAQSEKQSEVPTLPHDVVMNEQHKMELIEEMKRLCSKLVKDEIRKLKER